MAITATLRFKRMVEVTAEKGYAGPVVVCSVGYEPIAGQSPVSVRRMRCLFENKKTMGQMVAECSDVEYVTLARAEIENGKALCARYSQ